LRQSRPVLWALALLLAATLARGDSDAPADPDSATLAHIALEARGTLVHARRPGPLKSGEDLTFDVHYGVIHAGEAHLQIEGMEVREGQRCYRLLSIARSGGIFGKIYGVDDRIVSRLDSTGLMSLAIEKHLHEGSYHQEQQIRFDYASLRARYASGDSLPIPGPVQDDLTTLYVTRCLDLRENETFYLETHSNKVTYPMQVRVYGRETIETEAGKFECFRVEPRVDRGGIFKHSGRMMVWLTTDESHTPVRMKSKLPVGSITADLVAAVPPLARAR
jgi:hypothetical protein